MEVHATNPASGETHGTAVTQLLLRAPDAAALCGISLRTWRSWDAAGKIPQPVRIGRSTLWRAEEIRQWIAAGCPRRQPWEESQS
jgi:prophage regulatory protein